MNRKTFPLSMVNFRLAVSALAALLALGANAADPTHFVQFAGLDAHPTRILARFKAGQEPLSPSSVSVLAQEGVSVERTFSGVPGLVLLDSSSAPIGTQAVVMPDVQAEARALANRIVALRNSGLFQYVEPDYVATFDRVPDDFAFQDGTLWGLRNLGINGGVLGADISAPEAWNITVGSTNVIVAVVDSGVRYTHFDLRRQMWINPGEIPDNGIDDDKNGYIDDVHGIDATTRPDASGDPMDYNNHGTHVAGTIGAAANNGYPHVGVNWKVQIMAVKAGGETLLYADIVTAIDYAVKMGAKVMNGSFGGQAGSQAMFDSLLNARDKGVLFIAAAGNSGSNNDLIPQYPANYGTELDNVISVAALDNGDRLAYFSCYGANSVHLGAPGVEIYSTIAISDDAYDFFQGTSMAAPHVTGVVGLLYARYPAAPMGEIRERLLLGTVPLPALSGVTITGGRLNAYFALASEPSGQVHVSVDPPSGSVILAGQQQPVYATVTDVFPVRNATVRGRIAGQPDLIFSDNGVLPDQVASNGVYTAGLAVPDSPGQKLVMSVVASVTGKIGATNTVSYLIERVPANDNFANAAKIPGVGGVIRSNNRFATVEQGEPAHGNVPGVEATLWWGWSTDATVPAGSTVPVIVDTTGSAFRTVVAVYTGDFLTQLTEVTSASGTTTRPQAIAMFNARAGATYRIALGGTDPRQVGSIRLRLQPNGLPDTIGPLVSIDSPVEALITQVPRIIVSGTAIDPAPNASGVSDVFLRLNSAPLPTSVDGTTNWDTEVILRPGPNTIQVQAADFARNLSVPITLNVTYWVPGPVNDLFAEGTALAGNTGLATGSNDVATKETGEPNHAGNEGGRSLWWTYIPYANGTLNLSTADSDFDTLLAVYTGNRVTNLTYVASNDDAFPGVTYSDLTCGVKAGQTYHIAVDGFGGAFGQVKLKHSFTSGSLLHVNVAASPGGTVEPGSGDYLPGSTVTQTAVAEFGKRFVRWEGSVPSTANPLTFVLNRDVTLVPVFEEGGVLDDFETGGFNPQLHYQLNPAGSAKPWFVQSAVAEKGTYAARSGAITNAQLSILKLEEKFLNGVGSFSCRISTEDVFDELRFSINGVVLGTWSGETDWFQFFFNVPPGTNVLEWAYEKDRTLYSGMDAVFIDNLVLPVDTGEPAPSRVALSYSKSDSRLVLKGEAGGIYVIETSTDLRAWTKVSTVIPANGTIEIKDPLGPSQSTRFYRATKR